MKTLIIFLFVLFISFSTSYPQSRINGTERKNDDKTDKEGVVIKEIQRTPPPIIDRDTRDTPHNPPNRDPPNNNSNIVPTPDRHVSPPSNPINPPAPPVVIDYVPIPIYDDPPVDEPDYTYPIETTSSINIDHNYEELGLLQYKEEDYYNALASFQLALAKDTLHYSLYYYIGTTEIEIGRYDDAVISLTKFIDNVIENRLGFYQRGLANFYLGDRDAALDDFLIAGQYQVDEAKVILRRFYDYY